MSTTTDPRALLATFGGWQFAIDFETADPANPNSTNRVLLRFRDDPTKVPMETDFIDGVIAEGAWRPSADAASLQAHVAAIVSTINQYLQTHFAPPAPTPTPKTVLAPASGSSTTTPAGSANTVTNPATTNVVVNDSATNPQTWDGFIAYLQNTLSVDESSGTLQVVFTPPK